MVSAPSSVGIIFNTRDVWACLAEVEKSISNSVGIIFNTRVSEGCRSQFGVPPPIVRVLFLIPVMWGSRSRVGKGML